MRRRALISLVLPAVLGPACFLPADATPVVSAEVVDGSLVGAAFSAVADVSGDGRPDILTSSFGAVSGTAIPPGSVELYEQAPDHSWAHRQVVPPSAGIEFPNEPAVADIDGDGDADVVVPGGFFICAVAQRLCGSLTWWEQAPSGWRRHDVVPTGAPLFYHRAVLRDLDGDGRLDLLTVGESLAGAVTQVFPGTPSGFATTPVLLGPGLGSLPVVEDVDADGDLDVASAQYFQRDGSFAWLERVGPSKGVSPYGSYARHLISATQGGAIQLSRVGDQWFGTNHTNVTSGPPGTAASAVYELTPGRDPRLPWSATAITTGIVSRPDGALGNQQGAPGVFGSGDVDGDGDTDLAVSGDGDPRLFWVERTAGGWATHVLATGMGQAGGGIVTDLDGDGRSEVLFSSYDAHAVVLYRVG